VWTEIQLSDGDWIHIDPCEAAVNEPLLYQSWGKDQTFIFAYSHTDIDDVTFTYTSNSSAVYERRLREGVNESIFNNTLDTARQSLREFAL
jgi:peptide-N4-(N-acetyl-beta-glucosaminyl)asparagine amidase